jgi:hypothetical protein
VASAGPDSRGISRILLAESHERYGPTVLACYRRGIHPSALVLFKSSEPRLHVLYERLFGHFAVIVCDERQKLPDLFMLCGNLIESRPQLLSGDGSSDGSGCFHLVVRRQGRWSYDWLDLPEILVDRANSIEVSNVESCRVSVRERPRAREARCDCSTWFRK